MSWRRASVLQAMHSIGPGALRRAGPRPGQGFLFCPLALQQQAAYLGPSLA